MKWLAIFLLCAVAFLFILMGRPGRKARSLPEREPPREVEVFAQVPELTGYDVGFQEGYRAFLVQMGEDVPPVERYVSDHGEEFSEEEVSRGYVDGYHRAGAMMHCPRNY